MKPIYLDSHATTPVDPRVLEAMLPFFTEHFGNASSKNHPYGWAAAKAVERAREQVASLIGARFRDVVFTSGATESNNLAIKGVAARAPKNRGHVITVATEHRSVLDPCSSLARAGFRITTLGVDANGHLDLQHVSDALTDDTLLISVMSANNEIGVLHPIGDVVRLAHARGVIVHCDAVQSAGIVPLSVKDLGVDLLSLSAHKMYGPKGVGALYVAKRPEIQIEALSDGGAHERGYRSGTLNVPGIVGFGRAAELCAQESAESVPRLQRLRDRLWNGLVENLEGVHLNGSMERRLPQNLNVRVDGVHGETLLRAVAGHVAVSSGAACATASAEPSHVLRAIGLNDVQARASIRFGLLQTTSEQEIDSTVTKVTDVTRQLRKQQK